MFYDQAKITVTAGNGGNGAMHMRREKYAPKGGPDGGDGGRGGSVYVVADTGLNTLLPFRYKRTYKAQPGGAGSEKKMHGRAGHDLTISVPPGTIVRDPATGEVLADVVEPGKPVMVARGGRGGLGNTHFTTSTHQTPEFAQKGEPGEERELELELRVIADVGLVGYPNAGKSSLLTAISAATPKIANYPFTTLEPNLGVVGIGDASFVVADVPGLIEGAHEGAGLGLQFLRHLERTRLLVHVVDVAGTEGREPLEDLETINRELAQYSETLATRPQLVAANKMDLPDGQERWPAFKAALDERGIAVLPISAATREGLEPLLRTVARKLAEIREEEAEKAKAESPLPEDFVGVEDHQVFTPLQQSREFFVERAPDGVLEVTGKAAERLIQMTDLENEAALKYLQQRLRQTGITRALDRAGVQPGDTVRIGDAELEWMAQVQVPEKRRTAKQRKAG